MIATARSKPIPVSTWRCGKGVNEPSGFALNWMKTKVPNLDATRIIFVHERATRVAVWRQIDVHFRARSARAGVAHHPEIVGFSAAENVNFWIEIGFAK